MKKNILTLIFAGTVIVACSGTTTQTRPAAITGDSNMCPTAEEHLTQLCKKDEIVNRYCCEVVAPTQKGKSFTQFCSEKQAQGVRLNPGCLARITSCEQVDVCTSSN